MNIHATNNPTQAQLLQDCQEIIDYSFRLNGGQTPIDASKVSVDLFMSINQVTAAFEYLKSQKIATLDDNHEKLRAARNLKTVAWSEGIVFTNAGIAKWHQVLRNSQK